MRVSAVFQVQFPQARFVLVDTDVATQSRTALSRARPLKQKKIPILKPGISAA
jgi:hypothetical protein